MVGKAPGLHTIARRKPSAWWFYCSLLLFGDIACVWTSRPTDNTALAPTERRKLLLPKPLAAVTKTEATAQVASRFATPPRLTTQRSSKAGLLNVTGVLSPYDPNASKVKIQHELDQFSHKEDDLENIKIPSATKQEQKVNKAAVEVGEVFPKLNRAHAKQAKAVLAVTQFTEKYTDDLMEGIQYAETERMAPFNVGPVMCEGNQEFVPIVRDQDGNPDTSGGRNWLPSVGAERGGTGHHLATPLDFDCTTEGKTQDGREWILKVNAGSIVRPPRGALYACCEVKNKKEKDFCKEDKICTWPNDKKLDIVTSRLSKKDATEENCCDVFDTCATYPCSIQGVAEVQRSQIPSAGSMRYLKAHPEAAFKICCGGPLMVM